MKPKIFIFQHYWGFQKISHFCVETIPETKMNVTETWKKTIIDEKIGMKPVVKLDLHCDLSE